ncbi:MAG TPA: hypothetical protein VFE78_21235 [Gemmataceae bacterium]|nr:hypothetical protein [Gemmataceae bacterium]
MRDILPNPIVGILAGFGTGCLALMGLDMLGLRVPGVPGWGPIVSGVLGAVCGGLLGAWYERPTAEGGAVARWGVGMAAIVGCASFLVGFVGPILFQPDSPQGPLLGIFITGPLGTVAGAALGALIGLACQLTRRREPAA